MTLNIPRHVFGCLEGYRTLAVSPDVSRGERDELETFSFGQTSASKYLGSLGLKPAYWCRCLGSGRWAITRVLKGATDDQGRSTLLFVSALLEPEDWVEKLGADSAPLMAASRVWTWNGDAVLEPLKIAVGHRESSTPDSAQRARVLSMLALVEAKHGRPNETIVATEFEFSPDDVRLLATLLPRACKASFSWAVRSLSEGLPVAVNSLAGNASRGTATRRITRWSRSVSYDQPTYTAALAFFWKPGQPPPWEFVANCPSFGKETWGQPIAQTAVTRTSPQAPTARDRPSRRRGRPLWQRAYVGLAAILLLVVAATAVIVVHARQAKERGKNATALEAAVTNFTRSNPAKPLPKNPTERASLIKEARQLREEVTEVTKSVASQELDAVGDQMKEWLDVADESDREHAEIERRLGEFRRFADADGLRNFTEDSRYPTSATLKRVARTEEDLASAVKTRTVIAQLYGEDVARAREQLGAFLETCATIDRSGAERLKELQEYFDGDLPDRLTNDLINKEIPKRQEELEGLRKQMENILLENNPAFTTFSKDGFDNVTASADRWSGEIAGLRRQFDESYDKTAELIRDNMLRLAVSRPQVVLQRWALAQESLEHCQAALGIWADHAECVRQEKLINDWLDLAAAVAFEHFKNLVDQAYDAWTSEKKQAERENRKPRPASARDLVDEAVDYRKDIPDAIKQGDAQGEYREKAVQLQALLESLSRQDDGKKDDPK